VLLEYPLGSLPKLHHRKREQFESEGYEDMRGVPDDLLNAIQRGVKQCSTTGETFFDADGAAADLTLFGFPAYFLDLRDRQFRCAHLEGRAHAPISRFLFNSACTVSMRLEPSVIPPSLI